jgi:type I restriction enzyme S subunit
VLEHHSFNGTLASLATGSTIAHLPQEQLRRVPVPLPSRDEQCHIVDLLEDHLSQLEAGERWLSDGARKLKALWLAALSDSRRVLRTAQIRAIGDVAETTLGKMLDAKKQRGRPTPYLRNLNVRWREFDLSDIQVTPLTDSEVQRFDVQPGDVMACEGGEPGRCAVWGRPVSELAFQKALHRIRVHNPGEVLPSFLALMLEEAIRSGRCNRMFTGTTIKHLPQEKLRAIEIPVPTLDTQRQAVDRLAELIGAQERLRGTLANAAAHSAAMRRSLFAAAFSGRLTAANCHWWPADQMVDT